MNTDKQRIYFFLGYPKCASSTLQKHLFSQHFDICYLGLYPTKNIGNDSKYIDSSSFYLSDKRIRDLHIGITHSSDSEYLESKMSLLMSDILTSYPKNQSLILGSEFFTSTLFCNPNINQKIKRIKNLPLYSPPNFILIIREQLSWLRSQYRDHPFHPNDIEKGKFLTFNDWVKVLLEDKDNFNSLLSSLLYYERLCYLKKHFGNGVTKILLMEDLVNDMDTFSNEISGFLNINESETKSLLNSKHENISVSQTLNFIRKIHRSYFSFIKPRKLLGKYFVGKVMNMLNKFKSFEKDISLELDNDTSILLKEYFSKDNQQLNKELSGKLIKYNYIGLNND